LATKPKPGSAENPSDNEPSIVELIVRRGARTRFQTLKHKAASLPVKVIWDRRKTERRTGSGQPDDDDRRKSERRQRPPFSWQVADFVVVERPRRKRSKKKA